MNPKHSEELQSRSASYGGADKAPEIIYVDTRALQDIGFRFRGVGQHAVSIIKALRYNKWEKRRPRFIALVDHRLDFLHVEHARLFDEILNWPAPRSRTHSWFVSLSPMTHDPTWLSDLLLDPGLFKVALFYDFIQLIFPERYLLHGSARRTFLNCFAWLDRYDLFAAISEDTSRHLVRARNVDAAKVFVSGVAVREALEPKEGEEPEPRGARKHILVAGGEDPRKNPECVISAHARSDNLRTRALPIYIFGNYGPASRNELRQLCANEGGDVSKLQFLSHLTDEELRLLYRTAVMTIVPSFAEGFSIPIVESSASDTPAVVSDIGAHPELITDAALRFDPRDPNTLIPILDRLVSVEEEWDIARQSSTDLWRRYTIESVGDRFLVNVLAKAPSQMPLPAIKRGRKPQIAVLTPLPPARSGVADYSDVTLRAMTPYVDLHIFSESEVAVQHSAYKSITPVSTLPFSANRFDATLSVIGNSHHHLGAFHHLLQHGGAALAHDARMINFYAVLLGMPRTLEVATKEFGSPVAEQTVVHWLHNQENLPVLFLSEIAKAASPLIVHSRVTANKIAADYHTNPIVLPFAQYRSADLRTMTEERRSQARRKLGLQPDAIYIVTFGHLTLDKAPQILLWTLDLLLSWGVNANLVFCGNAEPPLSDELAHSAEERGIGDRVKFYQRHVTSEEYADFLLSADLAIQLRTYAMGGLSGALNDCISAAIPSIANAHLAEAMSAPDFVRRVPDDLSPVLIAEACLGIISSRQHKCRPIEAALTFRNSHTPDVYAKQMVSALGFPVK